MNGADYLILAVLGVSMIVGLLRGFLREAIGLLAWLGGLWLGWRYAHLLVPFFGGHIASPPVNIWVGRALILFGTLLVGWVIAAILGYFLQHSGLSVLVDRILGLTFGLLRGLVVLAIGVMLAEVVSLNDVRWWKQSRLVPYISDVASWIDAFAETGLEKRSDGVNI
jgi:membrane protein required for colicin V production